jgi:hypothetical protein
MENIRNRAREIVIREVIENPETELMDYVISPSRPGTRWFDEDEETLV